MNGEVVGNQQLGLIVGMLLCGLDFCDFFDSL